MSSQININDKLLTLLSKVSYSDNVKKDQKLSEIMKKGFDNEKITGEYIDIYDEMLAVNPAIADITVNRVENSNNKSGMVAQVYTIGNEIIITFRGTEIDKKEQIKKDLIETDLAFMNGFITKQQADVSNLMKEVYQEFPNANYTLAGHSLGGALAVTGAVFAPDNMKDSFLRDWQVC